MAKKFTFRVEKPLRKAFRKAARANARSSADLLIEFMQGYVARAEHDARFRAEVEEGLREAGAAGGADREQ